MKVTFCCMHWLIHEMIPAVGMEGVPGVNVPAAMALVIILVYKLLVIILVYKLSSVTSEEFTDQIRKITALSLEPQHQIFSFSVI